MSKKIRKAEYEFNPEVNSFILRQNGAKIKFVKNN